MKHEDSERAIAKAEIAYLRSHPCAMADSVAVSACKNGKVYLYGGEGHVLAVYSVEITRFNVKVKEIKP